jgi:hypothetical protein
MKVSMFFPSDPPQQFGPFGLVNAPKTGVVLDGFSTDQRIFNGSEDFQRISLFFNGFLDIFSQVLIHRL